MTLSEFKAWFEGFTENIDGAPTAKQFKKIKDKVSEIDGAVTTYPIYIERYRDIWPNKLPYWTQPWVTYSSADSVRGIGVGQINYSPDYGSDYTHNGAESTHPMFDPVDAMRALGQAEAKAA